MDIKQLISAYINWLKVRNYAYNTVKRRIYSLRKYSSTFNTISLKNVDAFSKNISNLKSYPIIVSDIKCFINYLEKYKLIVSNISDKIELPKQSKSLPKIIYSQKEILKMLNEIQITNYDSLRNKSLLTTLYATGIRIGELLNLKTYEINFHNKSIIIRNTKGKKDRIIPITSSLCKLIRDYIDKRKNNSPYLFSSEYGGKISHSYALEIIRIYFPKHFTPHSFRHHIATHLFENGMPPKYLQTYIGHSNIKSTMIYTHINNDNLIKEYRKYHPLLTL